MKIIYVANIRFPTEKAHGVQIVKTCEALVRAGADVELIVTDRHTAITEEPFSYYGVVPTFTVTRVHVPDIVHLGRIGFILETYLFARACRTILRTRLYDAVYGRDEMVLALLQGNAKKILWETHTGAENLFVRSLIRRGVRIVAISNGLKELYVRLGAKEENCIVAPDGVDLTSFEKPESKESARVRLGLPLDKRIVMYIGRLDGWKGTDTLLEAAKLLSSDVLLVVIGGEPKQIDQLRVRYPHVHFVGYRPYREIADNQSAADVLVLPNTSRDPVSVRFTSPLKLFTYMASGVPIVASDLPSIREIVDEASAYFVPPDSPTALAHGIEDSLKDPLAKEKVIRARALVEKYTWDARAKTIMETLASLDLGR